MDPFNLAQAARSAADNGMLQGLLGGVAGGFLVAGFNHFLAAYRESVTTRKALLAEAAGMHRAFMARLWWFLDTEVERNPEPLLPFCTTAYDELGDRMGSLPTKTAQRLFRYFGHLQFINERHKTQAEYVATHRNRAFRDLYVRDLVAQVQRGDEEIAALAAAEGIEWHDRESFLREQRARKGEAESAEREPRFRALFRQQ